MNSNAYFISPYGEIIESGLKHINIIFNNPEKFDLTLDEIKEVYIKYNERIGTEGKAREEIIIGLINKGWIRARYYQKDDWTINISHITDNVKNNLADFAQYVIKHDNNYMKLYCDVKIFSNIEFIKTDINKLANNALYN